MNIFDKNTAALNIVHKDYKMVRIVTSILVLCGSLFLCGILLSITGLCGYGVVMGLKWIWSFLVGSNWWLIFSIPLGITSLAFGLFILGLCLVFALSGIYIFFGGLSAFKYVNDERVGY